MIESVISNGMGGVSILVPSISGIEGVSILVPGFSNGMDTGIANGIGSGVSILVPVISGFEGVSILVPGFSNGMDTGIANGIGSGVSILVPRIFSGVDTGSAKGIGSGVSILVPAISGLEGFSLLTRNDPLANMDPVTAFANSTQLPYLSLGSFVIPFIRAFDFSKGIPGTNS
jgi:hypothetical protein